MKKEDLLKIIADDDLHILNLKPKPAPITTDDRLISSFEEINNFIKDNNREPKTGKGIQEHQLATRLKSIRADHKKIILLTNYDQFNLLDIPEKKINSLHDIFTNNDLAILEQGEANIFQLKNISQTTERNSTDYVARRKTCKNFAQYQNLFKDCQKDLSLGQRKLLKFNEKQIQAGKFFVMNGILLLVEKIFKTTKNEAGKIDGRIKCIFENGTESGMLFRSLGKGLYENGKAVSEKLGSEEETLLKNFNVINKEDKQTGFIYILKSLSTNPKISSIENLYKIGFSTTPVEERIKNASEDPTYLMAPVSIVTTFDCYNLNPQKLEQLLHNFFGKNCLNLDIFDRQKQRHTPREWFIAPLETIEQAIKLIISGGIVNYQYDSTKEKITLK